MRKIGQIFRFLIPVIAVVAVVVFMTGAATAEDVREIAARLGRNKDIVMRWNDEVWNKGNMAVADEIVASDCIRYITPDPSNPEGIVRGREAIKQFVMACRTAIPDWRAVARDVIAEGNKVAVRWANLGTFTGKVEGFPPPNGNKLAFDTVVIYRITGGKIVKMCEFNRDITMYYQMGLKVVPAQQ